MYLLNIGLKAAMFSLKLGEDDKYWDNLLPATLSNSSPNRCKSVTAGNSSWATKSYPLMYS